jgi:acetate kinase
MSSILVVNAGSSSVKFQIFGVEADDRLTRSLRGQMNGIGSEPHLRAVAAVGCKLIDRDYPSDEIADVEAALAAVANWLRSEHRLNPIAVGHRVVHGGPEYSEPVIVDADVLTRLEQYISLAPLHQPHNLAPIRVLLDRFPDLPQVACFDTAFHRGHGPLADHYALPQRFYDKGVRRYGFHGLSYEYIAGRLREVAPQMALKKVIVAHLGSGASMCAMQGGRSIESTMGFTALDGLPMGTRPGQIDPGVVLYLISQEGMSPADVQHLLYHESGLKGLSGVSADMRVLEESADPRAAFAIDYFVYRIALNAGMLAAALGGLDAFIFTAGIGENSARLRASVVDKLGWLGLALDPVANAAHALAISQAESRIPIYVIPTDEELMIARHALALLSTRPASWRMNERVA